MRDAAFARAARGGRSPPCREPCGPAAGLVLLAAGGSPDHDVARKNRANVCFILVLLRQRAIFSLFLVSADFPVPSP